MPGENPTPNPSSYAAAAPAAAPAAAARAALPGASLWRRSRWLRRGAWAVGGVLVLWAVGWLAVPPLLKWQGEKIASEQLGRLVQIGTVDFKPWTLELTLRDVSVAGANGAPPQLTVQRAYVDGELQSLLRLAPVIDAIQVDAPHVRLTHLGDGHYDIDDILARLAARPKSADNGEPARFALYNIELKGGQIDFDDRAVQRQHQVRDVQLMLPFISNLPSQREIKVQPVLAFVANGSAFDSRAQALPFDASRATDAVLRLSRLDLAPYLGYVPAGLPLKLTAGVVDAEVRLSFQEAKDAGGQASLRLGGNIALRQLKASDAQGAQALAFDALKVDLGDVRPLERKVHLASVELSGPQLLVRRDKDGQLNLLPVAAENAPEKVAAGAGGERDGADFGASSMPASTPASTPASKAAPARPASTGASAAAPKAGAAAPEWQVLVDRFVLQGGAVDFTDDSTAQGGASAARVQLANVALDAKAVAFPLAGPASFSGSAALVGAPSGGGKAQAAPAATVVASAAKSSAAKSSATKPGATGTAAAAASAPPAALPPASAAAMPAPVAGANIAFQGQAGAQGAEVNARLNGVPLALAGPYLAPYLVPQLGGELDAQLGLQWAPPKAAGLPADIKLGADELTLRQLALTDAKNELVRPAARGSGTARVSAKRAQPAQSQRTASRSRLPAGTLASVDQLQVSGAQIDLRTRSVNVGKLDVKAPRITVERSADGHLMAERWLRQPEAAGKPAKPPKAPAQAAEAPWKVALAEFTLDGGDVGWRDEATPRPVSADVTQLKVEASRLELGARHVMPLKLSARVGAGRSEPGRLNWRGQIGLEPISAQGQLDAVRLPVHAFEPYFGDALNIDILRADTSFKGQVAFTQTDKGPRARVQGDVGVQDLRTHSRPGTAAGEDAAVDAAVAASGEAVTRRRLDGTTTTTAIVPPRAAAPAASAVVAAGRGSDKAVRAPAPSAASRAPLAPDAAAANRAGGLGEELLSWKQLRVTGLDVRLDPGRPAQVNVRETALSDFYARIIVHANGRLNLQDLVRSSVDAAAAPAAAAPAAAASAPPAPLAPAAPAAGESSGEGAMQTVASGAASASASAAAQMATQVDANAPVVHVGPVRVANGRVAFSDRFIRPNYSADLTELNGGLSAFSTVAPGGAPQMADLKLTGRAEGSAALEVTGKLNPLVKPLALDIHGKVTDLELPPLSPYSVKYAGHGIERGKLSVDVNYLVQPDGRLTATNKLVLNQLEFGEPVPGAPASLPVKLATALLADSQGVIDLDLPISGSINDPQFSLGPIIVKAIFNLIGKAITAPFSLLARALGGSAGEDMSNVAFTPGSAALSAKARAQLDQVAKALADRPQLKLTVVGTASLAAERAGYQREKLKAMVMAEKRAGEGDGKAAVAPASRPAAAASKPIAAAAGGAPAAGQMDAETQLGDAEYAQLLRRVYRRADLPGKPRNMIGLQRDVPVPEMEALLMKHIDVSEDDIRQLAVQRGVAVKDYLAGKQLPTDRLFLGAPRASQGGVAGQAAASAPAPAASGAGAAPQAGWSPRAELALTAR